MATLLAMNWGGGRVPALLAAALTFIAGACSLARLNVFVRKPPDDIDIQ